MFIVSLFTIANTEKTPKWPLKDEFMKKIYTYTHYIDRDRDRDREIYIDNGILPGRKKEWNNAICSNMDEPRDY